MFTMYCEKIRYCFKYFTTCKEYSSYNILQRIYVYTFENSCMGPSEPMGVEK